MKMLTRLVGDDDPPSLDVGEVIEVLGNSRRRQLIHLLYRDSPLSVSDAAQYIAENEHDEVGSSERKSVYVSLLQLHLPAMDDRDTVYYDSDRKTIEKGPTFDCVHDALEVLEDMFGEERPDR